MEQSDLIMEALEEIKELLAEQNKHRFVEQYIDTTELMSLFNISKRTAQLWRNEGLIPFAQLGNKIYYRLSDLQECFESEFKKHPRVKNRTKLSVKATLPKREFKRSSWGIDL